MLDGIYYYAYDGGSRETPPIVLIHGAGGTHLSWPIELRRLPPYRVFSIDLPGHGKSNGCGHQTAESHAECVVNWLFQLGFHRAVFIGHSFGGGIAMTLALNHPEQVVGLGLIATGPVFPVRASVQQDVSNAGTFLRGIETFLGEAFTPRGNLGLRQACIRRMAEIRPSVMQSDLIACTDFDMRQKLGLLQPPALIVCGSEDSITPVRMAQFLQDSMPQARLHIIPDAGHMVTLEQPQTVAAAIGDFVETLVQTLPYRLGL
jgi:pimeloyl-ACP methyl ester carboxylesterase